MGSDKHYFPASDTLSKLRGGCASGWISSTTKSSLSTTFCYKVLEDKMDYFKGKGSCQRVNSIMLEFDTRGEVKILRLMTFCDWLRTITLSLKMKIQSGLVQNITRIRDFCKFNYLSY